MTRAEQYTGLWALLGVGACVTAQTDSPEAGYHVLVSL